MKTGCKVAGKVYCLVCCPDVEHCEEKHIPIYTDDIEQLVCDGCIEPI
jgi:hypothetical protein